MVPAYRAAAKFIEKTRDLYPNMIYTSVSFVGSTALASELMLLGKKYATGVIVTQVVPALDGHSSLVLDYKSALDQILPRGGAGLRVSRRLRGGQRVNRSVETKWPSARHRKTGRYSREISATSTLGSGRP